MNNRTPSVLAAALLVAGLCLSAGAASALEKGRIGVELNKLEAAGDACRAYLLLSNGTAAAFTSLKLDLVTFDADGIVQRRVAVEAAPIGAGKTSLKVFDISGIQCQAIGRMLLNGVMSCKGAKAEPADCLALVSVTSRAAQPFIK